MIACPECGAGHFVGTLFCDQCGAAVHPAAIAHIARERAAAAPPPPPTRPEPPLGPRRFRAGALPPAGQARQIRARIEHCGAEELLAGDVLTLGRADPDDGFEPDLDLSGYRGLEMGVSRRHVMLRALAEGVVITDMGSSNGTFLEGHRLAAGYYYLLPENAAVRLGDMVVYLSIVD